MRFSEFIGNELVIDILRKTSVDNMFANAYMFVGQRGVGRFTAAKSFAQAANCMSPSNGDSCGICSACLKIERANHPDYFELYPEDGSIKIEQIRKLQRSFSYSVYEGRHRFAIIDSAHLMTEEAANCLLKTLEEPPPDSSIILICPSVHSVLPTLVSRSHVFNFNSVPTDSILSFINKVSDVDSVTASFISYLAAGSVGDCFSYLKDDNLMSRRSNFIDIFIRLFTELPYAIMDSVDAFSSEIQIEMLEIWLLFVNDIVSFKRNPFSIINGDYRSDIARLSVIPVDSLVALINLIKKTIHFIKRNGNIRIHIEYLASYCFALNKIFIDS